MRKLDYIGRIKSRCMKKMSNATKVPSRKPTKASQPAVKILSAPPGPRTVSHRDLKKAIEKVFRERQHANA